MATTLNYNRAFAIRLATILSVASREGLVSGIYVEWLEYFAARMLKHNIDELYNFKLNNIDYYYLELFGIVVLEFRDTFGRSGGEDKYNIRGYSTGFPRGLPGY